MQSFNGRKRLALDLSQNFSYVTTQSAKKDKWVLLGLKNHVLKYEIPTGQYQTDSIPVKLPSSSLLVVMLSPY